MNWQRIITVLFAAWLALVTLKHILLRKRDLGRIQVSAGAGVLVGAVPPLEQVPAGAKPVWRNEPGSVRLELAPPTTLDYGPILEP